MRVCRRCAVELDLYLDGELADKKLDAFRRHLDRCSSCRQRLDERQQFLDRVREARPRQAAPLALRRTVERLLEAEVTVPGGKSAAGVETQRFFRGERRFFPFAFRLPAGLSISAVAILACLTVWMLVIRASGENAFVDLAISNHQRQVAGQAPLEKQTGSPAEMAAWFSGRVSFPFRLPMYHGAPGSKPNYALLGGRVIRVNHSNAAYIAYTIDHQVVSLIAMARSDAAVGGGEVAREKGIWFYSHRKDGLQVMTWSVHDVTYALVSSVTVPGRESCVVCHSRPEEKYLLRRPVTHAKLRTLERTGLSQSCPPAGRRQAFEN